LREEREIDGGNGSMYVRESACMYAYVDLEKRLSCVRVGVAVPKRRCGGAGRGRGRGARANANANIIVSS
jgi:hypothetical protein